MLLVSPPSMHSVLLRSTAVKSKSERQADFVNSPSASSQAPLLCLFARQLVSVLILSSAGQVAFCSWLSTPLVLLLIFPSPGYADFSAKPVSARIFSRPLPTPSLISSLCLPSPSPVSLVSVCAFYRSPQVVSYSYS